MATVKTKWLKKIVSPINEFISMHELSGYLLLFATFIALFLANSPWSEGYLGFWQQHIHFGFGSNTIDMSLEHLINDGLMTLFFVVVGAEIKRELIEGELSTKEKALLPVIGAVGGMLFPALFFVIINFAGDTASGWAIPTATDIAFSLTVISLLKGKVPLSLKIFLTALAIVDDLGAILVIAVFYSSDINWTALFFGAITTLGLLGLNKMNVKSLGAYMTLGAVLWFCLHSAGIHATISGVILAMCVPFRFSNFNAYFNRHVGQVQYYAKILTEHKNRDQHMIRDQIIEQLQKVSTSMEAPLNNLLFSFHNVSSFLIMPLFALANAGVAINTDSFGELNSPLCLGIMAGLLLGKPLGITFTIWVFNKLRITALPADVKWKDLFMTTVLAGIGFTMSIFITNLAFDDKVQIENAKLAIIIASFTAGIVGFVMLFLKKTPEEEVKNLSLLMDEVKEN